MGKHSVTALPLTNRCLSIQSAEGAIITPAAVCKLERIGNSCSKRQTTV